MSKKAVIIRGDGTGPELINSTLRIFDAVNPSNIEFIICDAGNEWWETDIKDDLKNAHCLVTNMSLAAIDAVMNMVPAITHQRNVASFVTSREISKIKKPMRPGRKTMNEWLKMLSDNQFTIKEIEHGLAYEILKGQL